VDLSHDCGLSGCICRGLFRSEGVKTISLLFSKFYDIALADLNEMLSGL
jgi:hypothetical protein